MANRGNINEFLKAVGVRGGFSFSNSYLVKFNFTSESIVPAHLASAGVDFSNNSNDMIELLCDEAQLPNINASTGTQVGRYLGEASTEYPTSKIFTEFQLGWMCDANMTQHKFLSVWFDAMFSEEDFNKTPYDEVDTFRGKEYDDVITKDTSRNVARNTRLRYPAEYLCDILVAKTETGPKSATQRTSEIYVMEGCFPRSIDAVPLSYGTSQVTKVSAQFRYRRHYVIYNDVLPFNAQQGTNSREKGRKAKEALQLRERNSEN